KPRRMNKVITHTRRVPRIKRDASGNPIFPLKVGILRLINVGTVVADRPEFHNERYIWPVGYKVSRPFASLVDKDRDTTVTCTVLDGGNGPRFMLEFADIPDQPIIAQTATGAWTAAVRRANELRQREHSNSASGPDYFGFSNSLIAKIIQELPNAEKCLNYHRQTFEE
ncbi:MAG: F/Y rich C-terminus-domain-containing protein, partial [Piptocephalis tieghemiana]